MSMVSSSSRLSYRGISYISDNSLQHCVSFTKITPSDLNNFLLVNKVWKRVIDSPEGQVLWKEASIKEGVPIVQGKNRNHKNDLKILRPITISSKVIGEYLGDVVGDVPLMREDLFTRLKHAQDDFEPEKFQKDTHVVIIDPSKLKITVSPNRPLKLSTTGTLVEVPLEEQENIVPQELTVSFSFKNLKMLATYPLSGKEHGPVFNPVSWPEVFNQCDTPPDQNRILIMRREVVEKGIPFVGEKGQEAWVTNHGWKVVLLRQRGFYDAITILKTGMCSDTRAPEVSAWTYARSDEGVRLRSGRYRAAIGGFIRGVGVNVSGCEGYVLDAQAGVVPGVSAGVRDHRDLKFGEGY
ncbi:MAG: hypothetical protein V4489_04790 [Chlamydiota bacterium]